jgi:nucleotide-binding universal stress UspA family protein
MALLERVVVPVADEQDSRATAAAVSQHVHEVQSVVAVHVVEKGGGAVDKTPVEKRRADAAELLSVVESRLDDEVAVETRVVFGTDVAETVVETALDVEATAIAFRSRGGSRLVRFLSGDTAARLVNDPELPVVSLDAGNAVGSTPRHRARDGDAEVGG